MARIGPLTPCEVRPPLPGDGAPLAVLWKQLWDLHEGWGGYAGSQEASVYAAIAEKIDEHARLRGGSVFLGPHAHLVATVRGAVRGQIEGWCERLGSLSQTPIACDIRSLVVDPSAHRLGLGRALLNELEACVRRAFAGEKLVLSAEVHVQNPANAFYQKLGFRPACYTFRLDTHALKGRPHPLVKARPARPKDAAAILCLDETLAQRRERVLHDPRFDPPSRPDFSMLPILATHLERETVGAPRELVVTIAEDTVVGSATLATSLLPPPFLPRSRALLGRFAFDPSATVKANPRGHREAAALSEMMLALLETAASLSRAQASRHMELTDLEAAGGPLTDAAIAAGASPWSCTYVRDVPA